MEVRRGHERGLLGRQGTELHWMLMLRAIGFVDVNDRIIMIIILVQGTI